MLPGLNSIMAGIGLAPITITDHGDATPDSGVPGTATHTYNSLSTTGPVSAVMITWQAAASRTLDSVTWGGNAVTLLVNSRDPTGIAGAAIGIRSGSQSGNLVLNFSGTVTRSAVTRVSLANLSSLTAVDTDSESDAGGGSNLDSLTSPGVGGIRLAAYYNGDAGTSISWTNATEIADMAVNSIYAHSAAYDLGDDGGTIDADGGVDADCIVGVSLR